MGKTIGIWMILFFVLPYPLGFIDPGESDLIVVGTIAVTGIAIILAMPKTHDR
jgi:hypothetical protein